MGKILVGILVITILLVGAVFYFKRGNLEPAGSVVAQPKINLSSDAFVNGQNIPYLYTCDGDNINPGLAIDRVSSDAKSLVVIVDDPDAGKTPFTHWIVFNIDPGLTNIEQGKIPNALEGTNDYGEIKYMGPCPPKGSTHKYYFRIYALDITLSLQEGASRVNVDTAMKGHILGYGELWARYGR